MGDTPYSEREVARLDRLIDDINAHSLAFVVHLGDIGNSSTAQGCGDTWIEERRTQFRRIKHPFVLIPGDNEWSECADPVARLAKWRQLFCFQERLSVERQKDWCEHLRWQAGGFVFATLNVPGNNNNAQHPEHAERMAAVFAWMDEAEKHAQAGGDALALLMQANPFLWRGGYDALQARLEALAGRMPGRVLLIHGDTHLYRDDEPLPGLRRIETWGSPFVSWLPATAERGVLRSNGPR